MSYKYTFPLICISIFLSLSFNSYCQSLNFTETGYGKTERDALEDARRKIIQVGIEELYADFPQQREAIRGKVTDKPHAYLKNEEILDKDFDTDKQEWEIELRATVSRSMLEKDIEGIETLLDRVNRPKILVIPAYYTNNPPEKELTDLACYTINKYLGALGFTYVSIDAVSNIMRQMSSYTGSQSIRDVAIKADAPIYITVNVSIDEKGKGVSGAYFSNANVNLEAFDTENGQGLGTSNKSSGKIGQTESQREATFTAIKEAAEKTAEDIVSQLVRYLGQIAQRGMLYEIRIFGIDDYMVARKFKDALTNYDGFVGDIRMSKQTNFYRFEITYKSPRPDETIDAIFDAVYTEPIFRKLDLKTVNGKLIDFILE